MMPRTRAPQRASYEALLRALEEEQARAARRAVLRPLPDALGTAYRPDCIAATTDLATKESFMPCTRCAGMTVQELLSEGGTRIMACRCIHCGDVVDRVILRNRMGRRIQPPSRARTQIYGRPRLKRRLRTLAVIRY